MTASVVRRLIDRSFVVTYIDAVTSYERPPAPRWFRGITTARFAVGPFSFCAVFARESMQWAALQFELFSCRFRMAKSIAKHNRAGMAASPKALGGLS